jgi:hypothetical protein
MGSGYSIVDGNVEISKERMQKIYAKYTDPSAYDVWKKQLEDAAKEQELYYENKKKNVDVRKPEYV